MQFPDFRSLAMKSSSHFSIPALCQLGLSPGNSAPRMFGTIAYIIFTLMPAGSHHGSLINLLTMYINPQNDPDNLIGCRAAQSQFTSDHLLTLFPPGQPRRTICFNAPCVLPKRQRLRLTPHWRSTLLLPLHEPDKCGNSLPFSYSHPAESALHSQ